MVLTQHTRDKVLVGVITILSLVACMWQEVEARDLFAPKEQATTEVDPTQSPSFDQQETGIPQSLFTWLKMAKGYDIEWDTFGRKGWYTQDPRLKPIEPGSVFPRDIPAIYIVFESAPLEDPAQFSAQWYLESEKGVPSSMPLGKDILEPSPLERARKLAISLLRLKDSSFSREGDAACRTVCWAPSWQGIARS